MNIEMEAVEIAGKAVVSLVEKKEQFKELAAVARSSSAL